MISPIYMFARKGAEKIIRLILEECTNGKYTLVDKEEDTWKGKYDFKTRFPPCGGERFREYTLVLDKQEKTVAIVEFPSIEAVRITSFDKDFDSLEKVLSKSLSKLEPQSLSELADWPIKNKSDDETYEIGKLYFQKSKGGN